LDLDFISLLSSAERCFPLVPDNHLISLLDISNPMGKGKLHVPPTATGKLDIRFGGTFPISTELPGSPVIYADEHEIQLLELLCCETGVRGDSSP